MDITKEIIKYCMIYGFCCNEANELFIGNLHSLDAEIDYHNWTMFVSASKHKLVPPKTIKQVTYYLHPTFPASVITEKQPPFYFNAKGWGTFVI